MAASKTVSHAPSSRRSAKADSELLNIIVCIGLEDRLEAMKIRDSDGPEAAISFIRETCTLTNEGEQAREDVVAGGHRVIEALKAIEASSFPRITLENDGGYADPELVPECVEFMEALAELETALARRRVEPAKPAGASDRTPNRAYNLVTTTRSHLIAERERAREDGAEIDAYVNVAIDQLDLIEDVLMDNVT